MTDDQEQHDRTATYGQTLVKIVFIALATLPMSGSSQKTTSECAQRVHPQRMR